MFIQGLKRITESDDKIPVFLISQYASAKHMAWLVKWKYGDGYDLFDDTGEEWLTKKYGKDTTEAFDPYVGIKWTIIPR